LKPASHHCTEPGLIRLSFWFHRTCCRPNSHSGGLLHAQPLNGASLFWVLYSRTAPATHREASGIPCAAGRPPDAEALVSVLVAVTNAAMSLSAIHQFRNPSVTPDTAVRCVPSQTHWVPVRAKEERTANAQVAWAIASWPQRRPGFVHPVFGSNVLVGVQQALFRLRIALALCANVSPSHVMSTAQRSQRRAHRGLPLSQCSHDTTSDTLASRAARVWLPVRTSCHSVKPRRSVVRATRTEAG